MSVNDILKQPIEKGLLEHFIKYITMVQDWDKVMVWELQKNTNPDKAFLTYCYKREEGNKKWVRCSDSPDEKNSNDIKKCKVCKSSNGGGEETSYFDNLKNWIIKNENIHLSSDEADFPIKNSKRKVSLEKILTKRFIPELYEKDKAKYKYIRLIFEYPSYTIFPKEESTSHKLGLHYERKQIDILRQMAMQLKVKQETEKHGTKSAVLSIDVRNLSHNIGSHVLAYWIQELNQLLQNFCSENNKLQTAINKSKALFRYIQHRGDFLAEVATSIPCSEMSFDLEKDVLNPFLKDNNNDGLSLDSNVLVLLRYIAESEGIAINFGDNENTGEQSKRIIKIITCEIDESLKESINGESKEKPAVWVSIPSGIIGKHAIYSIFENFIRNAAKHYKVTADFSEDEFSVCGYTAQNLFTKIKEDDYNHINGSDSTDNSDIDRLNSILQIEDLSEQIKNKKFNNPELPEKRTSFQKQIDKKTVNENEATDEAKEKIKMLNRLMIERAYQDSPKLEKYINNSDFIKINVSVHDKDFIKVEITDIRKYSCNKDIIEKLSDYLKGGFVDKNGKLKPGGWGTKEMLVSANFLRKNTPEDLYDIIKGKPCNPPLLTIICTSNGVATENQKSEPDCNNCDHNKKLGIRFYLRRPKHLAVMVENINDKNIEKTVFEIKCITTDEFKDKPIPHNILLVDKKTYNDKYKDKDDPIVPCRVMIYDNQEGDNGINDNYYLYLYREFINKEINSKFDQGNGGVPEPKIVNDLHEDYKFQDINGISIKSFKDAEGIKALDNIVFKDHPEEGGIDDIFSISEYFQPMSGGFSTKAKFFKNKSLPDEIREHFYLELIEAALTEVVIVDERISEWANKKTKYYLTEGNVKLTVRDMLRKMKVYVPEIKKDNITYEELKNKLSQKVLCCNVFLCNKKNNAHFFVIHQGVLEKLEGNNRDSFINEDIKCRWKVIDSGRGVPEEMEHRFVQISALQTLLENYDKHGLVQILFSLRKPVKEEQSGNQD